MPAHQYSSDVSLKLIVGGVAYPLSQIGPGYAIPKDRIELKPCIGKMVVSVDGVEDVCTVRVVEDFVPFDDEIKTIRCLD